MVSLVVRRGRATGEAAKAATGQITYCITLSDVRGRPTTRIPACESLGEASSGQRSADDGQQRRVFPTVRNNRLHLVINQLVKDISLPGGVAKIGDRVADLLQG